MNTDAPAFFNQFYPLQILQTRSTLVNDLTRFILQGVRNRYGIPGVHPLAREFESSVRGNVFNAFVTHSPDFAKKAKLNHGDTAELVIEAFDEASAREAVDLRVSPSISDKTVLRAFELTLGTYSPEWKQASADAGGAYAMALDNLRRAETRRVALTVLHNLLRASPYCELQLTGADEIRAELHRRAADFLQNAVCFGLLLGADARREVSKALANSMCYDPSASISYSVMQFLQPDGESVGSYLTATEETFNADIQARYNAL